MKLFAGRIGRLLFLCGVCGLVLVPEGQAVRGRDDALAKEAYAARKPNAQPLQLSNEQLALVREARQEGLGVHIRDGWATRISLCGENLGSRRSFSRGKGLALRGSGAFENDAVAVLDNLSGVIGARQAEKEFSAHKVSADSLGFHHVRIRQLHRGLKVVGGDLIVHFNAADEPYQVNGSYIPGVETDTHPQVDAVSALQVAEKNLAALGEELDGVEQAPKLVVYARGCAPVLAYELSLSSLRRANQAPGVWRYWVDAQSGEVVARYNDVKDVSAPGSSGSHMQISGEILSGEGGGVKSVEGWHDISGRYYLYNKNLKWFIYNVSTAATYEDANTYAYRMTDDWEDSDPMEMSAAVCLDAAQTYFKNVHSRNSYNGLNAYARVNVHEGDNYVNAFWSPTKQQFFIGDGDGAKAGPLAVMDIMAHEYTHAVTDYSADLVYSYEPGALNESFSDIFGACVEFATQPDGRSYYDGDYPFSRPGKADWLMGEDAWKSSAALRDMRNPRNSTTVGFDNVQPSRYFGEYWYTGSGDYGGVHINSGVQNFFFYLLCEGGTGWNDGIAYDITGIGIANAEKIAYLTLTAYCTSSTDYRDVREAWVSAALQLNPAWADVVRDVWRACGIGPVEIQPSAGVQFAGKQGGAFRPWQHTFTIKNTDSIAIPWTVSTAESWLKCVPESGVLAPGATASVQVQLTAAAESLGKTIYAGSLFFRTTDNELIGSREVLLRVGQPDYYTELFSSGDFDLNGFSLTFTPDGSDSYYSANALPITSLPISTAGHSAVGLGDDSYYQIPGLSGGKKVKLYSKSYDRFYIGSNGYLTFDRSDTIYTESFADHFAMPRISGLFDDLDPSGGGSVKWQQLADRVVVTYSGVPEFSQNNSNTFQIEMFFDETIRMSWLGVAARDGLVGLSRGKGQPNYYQESDLKAFGWDYDGDGIPNDWEKQYFGANTACDADADFDGDGFSNKDEYISGQHPKNRASFFEVAEHTVSTDDGTGYVITWDAVEDREYSIWWTMNLIYVDFELLEEGLGYPANSYTDSVHRVSDGAQFYQVRVKLIE